MNDLALKKYESQVDYMQYQEEKAKVLREKLFEEMGRTEGLFHINDLEFSDDEESQKEWCKYSSRARELWGAGGFELAKAIVECLEQNQHNPDRYTKTYPLAWNIYYYEDGQYLPEPMTRVMTYQQMLTELTDIAFEDFGEDLEKWQEWIAFRKEHGFFRGR